MAHDQSLPDSAAGAGVPVAVDVGGGVADRVQTGDRLPVRGGDAGRFVGGEPSAGAEIGEHHSHRVEAALVERTEVGVGLHRGITVVAVVGALAAVDVLV